jgi:general secretion pathway protein B
MSYILDALKKSEQQRQRSQGSSINAPTIAPYSENSNSLLLYALIATILLGIILILSLLHPWTHESSSQIAATETTQVSPPSQEIAPQAQRIQPTPSLTPSQSVKPLEKRTVATNKNNTRSVRQEIAKVKPNKPIEVAQSPVISNPISKTDTPQQPTPLTPTPIETPSPAEVANADEPHPSEISLHNRLLELSELPSNIQQDIPDMSVAGYVLSENPKERSVGINGHLFQEGDYIKQGIRLEHIAPEGLIFSYKNYHFRQSLQ